ncbi:MAG: stage II sporulation protein E, partial [Bacteroidales bacterium]|nr:stage II sporulation protein E [Bacteroidales bacterium]
TLGMVAEMLEKDNPLDEHKYSPAWDLIRLIMESDIIDLLIGTRINEAHQDPSLPVELEIRRNVVKRIAALLEEKWLKKVNISYL